MALRSEELRFSSPVGLKHKRQQCGCQGQRKSPSWPSMARPAEAVTAPGSFLQPAPSPRPVQGQASSHTCTGQEGGPPAPEVGQVFFLTHAV